MTWNSKLERKGYPNTIVSTGIFEWLEYIVIPETKEWINEEELNDIINSKNN